MGDLPERLEALAATARERAKERENLYHSRGSRRDAAWIHQAMHTLAEAAARIRSLEGENERLRGASRDLSPAIGSALELYESELRDLLYEINESEEYGILNGDGCQLVSMNQSIGHWRCVKAFLEAAYSSAKSEDCESSRDDLKVALAKAVEGLEIWDKAFETGRSEPLYIARDHGRETLAVIRQEPRG